MVDSTLTTERREGLALLTLNRPHRMNALSRDLLSAFATARDTLLPDPTVRAIVITGSGDRAFCAGADLKERSTMTLDEVRQQLLRYEADLGWLASSPKPTVAALNGVTLGGGLELALLCDFRVADKRATMGLPETSLGIIPGAGGTQRLTRLVGAATAKTLILLGKRLTAREALGVGLIDEIAPSRDLLDFVAEWLRPITEGAPIAQEAALQAIRAADDLALEQGLALERALYERCLVSADRDEALQAFKEKRQPVFSGR